LQNKGSKFVPRDTIKATRKGRNIAPLILYLYPTWAGQPHASAKKKPPLLIKYEAGWNPQLVWACTRRPKHPDYPAL